MDNSYLKSKKLLLVDDEPELLTMLTTILFDDGFNYIVMASTVQEAISKARSEKPDLIFLDVMLPDGDGFSLMQQIRKFTDVPVIFLTAKDEATAKLSGLVTEQIYSETVYATGTVVPHICAVYRRCYKGEALTVSLDGCIIDFGRAEINKNGEIILFNS